MISANEIRSTAALKGVAPRVIEKDYYLGLMLWAIAKDKEKKHFIFKGGTALKKCYIENYRFSEDIDFTVTYRKLNNKSVLTELLTKWCGKCNKQFGSSFRFFDLALERETYSQESFKGTLHYTGIESIGKINIDLTFYENVELAPRAKLIKHSYSDKDAPAKLKYLYIDLKKSWQKN